MTLYRIELHDEVGDVREIREQSFEHDDDAIDCAGAIDHPHEINVWQDERRVAHFPPIAPPLSRPTPPREA